MAALNIRYATLADLDACYEIESACFLPSEAASRAAIETRITTFPQGFLVAELNGNVVGQLNSGATNLDDLTNEEFKQLIGHDPHGKHLVIFSLAVLPGSQRQGIAGRLLRQYLYDAERSGRAAVLLLCKSPLIGFYQRFDFVDHGKSASTHGGYEWHEMARIF
ncbi:GNAT family N-acetyltransferase [candidate division KSB3 bacterium]|uniref:GNAT family N-acetyltransferase n=1 Tax=candidate division KSB3 bacterium TaxID=2044937 RepID=A0A2G6E3M3_9BACT|nr:MAG: GNAT family N-acetyltransferase [candidate division KSB3 bacterium]PIE29281.1 MAG: GNAT family N-acetyltransferase [candidate division KSB3 bacterium]